MIHLNEKTNTWSSCRQMQNIRRSSSHLIVHECSLASSHYPSLRRSFPVSVLCCYRIPSAFSISSDISRSAPRYCCRTQSSAFGRPTTASMHPWAIKALVWWSLLLCWRNNFYFILKPHPNEGVRAHLLLHTKWHACLGGKINKCWMFQRLMARVKERQMFLLVF